MIETEQIFVFIGVILVIFFAILLLTSKKYKNYPNKFLAAALLTLSVLILRLRGLLEDTFIGSLTEVFRIEYLFSVFLYLYVCYTLKKKVKRSTQVLLILPFIIFSGIYAILFYIEWFAYDLFENFIEVLEPLELYIPILFNSTVIIVFTQIVYQSEAQKTFKKWIYIIAMGLMLVMAGFLILEFIEAWFDLDFWNYIGITFSIFFISITYLGVQQLHIEQEQITLKKIYKKKTPTTKNKIGLSHFERMQLIMEEQELFKDPSFDRERLASEIGLSSSSITRILKEEGQVRFNDFVNTHRIKLAKKLLTDTRFHIFSLEAIGKEVGFKSRSTFYETFKKEVGVSPGIFKKQ